MEQMTIFDYITKSKPTADSSAQDIAEYIGQEFGLTFKVDGLNAYKATLDGGLIEVRITKHERYIGTDVSLTRGSMYGGCSPCESLEEVERHVAAMIRNCKEQHENDQETDRRWKEFDRKTKEEKARRDGLITAKPCDCGNTRLKLQKIGCGSPCSYHSVAYDRYIFRVFCPKCGAVAQEVEDCPADSKTRGGAVRNWNERPHIIEERYTKPEQFRHEEDMEEEGNE